VFTDVNLKIALSDSIRAKIWKFDTTDRSYDHSIIPAGSNFDMAKHFFSVKSAW